MLHYDWTKNGEQVTRLASGTQVLPDTIFVRG
jgi:hypothetical protein